MNTNLSHCELDLLSLSSCNYLIDEGEELHVEASGPKVLVVGTTSDYVDFIRRSNPGRVLYLTAMSERSKSTELRPLNSEEIVCNLEDEPTVILKKIQDHTCLYNSSVEGVACFDCESLELAAVLAEELDLPYPSLESIRLCRDKFVTKTLWQEKKVACPRHRLVETVEDVVTFWQEINGPVVIKPLSGSGSELVFLCVNRKECEKAVHAILEGLAERKEVRLYRKAITRFVVEEFVTGVELSCDFTFKNDRVEILRLTRKIKLPQKHFGTIDGYMITDWQRAGINQKHLSTILKRGAEALGISDAICMVDFIVNGDTILLLEMTPRPGGDCIPSLLQRAVGFDVLGYCMKYAKNHTSPLPVIKITGEGLVALRFHAKRSGQVTRIESNNLLHDSRTREINLIRGTGHMVVMPPIDYDSWYLGYVLFKPEPGVSVEQQCRELRSLLEVEMKNDDN